MDKLPLFLDLHAVALFLLLGSAVGLIAGLFGVGGGLLIVPVLIWGLPLIDVDPAYATHIAIGTSLATIVVTSISALRAHHVRGGVLWREVGLLTPGILLGAWLGGRLAGAMRGETLQQSYGLFALLVGLHLFFRVRTKWQGLSPAPWLLGPAAVVIGTVSALVGIGGGTLTVPLLNAVGVEMRKAVGTASACGLPLAVTGTLVFAYSGWGLQGLPAGSTGFVYWPVMFVIVISSTIFAPLGASLAHRLPGEKLKRLFGVVLFLIGGRLLFG